MTNYKPHDESQERQATVLRRIYRVIADKNETFEGKVEELLKIGRETLGTEYGALSYVEDGDYVFETVHDPSEETTAGDVVPLEETNCERAIDTKQTLVLADIETEAPELTSRAGFTDMGVQCYIGTPVVVDEDVYGTFFLRPNGSWKEVHRLGNYAGRHNGAVDQLRTGTRTAGNQAHAATKSPRRFR
ncbi:GAF domain-containing protein [Haladaptatus sp. DFWS20]|uniref:GAF domain-containing protein n=1 Tax=Haladaptatus sp. DFWS20 TaxID=3403467 RepID=UPI003EB8A321